MDRVVRDAQQTLQQWGRVFTDISPSYFVSVVVWLPSDVAGEHLIDTLLAHQLLSPHLQQSILGTLALQVKQVVIVQLAESRRGRVTPETRSDSLIKNVLKKKSPVKCTC